WLRVITRLRQTRVPGTMTMTISRRSFNVAVLTGLGAAAVPAIGSAAMRNLKIGCTSLIWGALPRSPDNLGPAVKDMAGRRFYALQILFASFGGGGTTRLSGG